MTKIKSITSVIIVILLATMITILVIPICPDDSTLVTSASIGSITTPQGDIPHVEQTIVCELPVDYNGAPNTPSWTNNEDESSIIDTPHFQSPNTVKDDNTEAPPATPDVEEVTTVTSTTKKVTEKTPEPIDPIKDGFEVFSTYLYNGREYPMPLSKELQYHTYQMCEKYDLPYRIIMGMMGTETGWNANAGNERGYIGIGCISEKYYAKSMKNIGVDIYTVKGNIEAICIIMRDKMDEFNNNIIYAMMAYNGGSTYARNLIKKGYSSTTYTKRTIGFAESLK